MSKAKTLVAMVFLVALSATGARGEHAAAALGQPAAYTFTIGGTRILVPAGQHAAAMLRALKERYPAGVFTSGVPTLATN